VCFFLLQDQSAVEIFNWGTHLVNYFFLCNYDIELAMSFFEFKCTEAFCGLRWGFKRVIFFSWGRNANHCDHVCMYVRRHSVKLIALTNPFVNCIFCYESETILLNVKVPKVQEPILCMYVCMYDHDLHTYVLRQRWT
jgi:hypothetical protein